jgi:hypothetical protein
LLAAVSSDRNVFYQLARGAAVQLAGALAMQESINLSVNGDAKCLWQLSVADANFAVYVSRLA